MFDSEKNEFTIYITMYIANGYQTNFCFL